MLRVAVQPPVPAASLTIVLTFVGVPASASPLRRATATWPVVMRAVRTGELREHLAVAVPVRPRDGPGAEDPVVVVGGEGGLRGRACAEKQRQ